MKTLVSLTVMISLTLGAASTMAAGKKLKRIIKSGQFAFTDGSSIFQLKKGGTFELQPRGMSGRTVRVLWKTSGYRIFTIVGKWSWINGASPRNDYRRMKLHITYMGGAPGAKKGRLHRMKLYPVYFTIEQLLKISKAAYRKAGGK